MITIIYEDYPFRNPTIRTIFIENKKQHETWSSYMRFVAWVHPVFHISSENGAYTQIICLDTSNNFNKLNTEKFCHDQGIAFI